MPGYYNEKSINSFFIDCYSFFPHEIFTVIPKFLFKKREKDVENATIDF